jgi:hypothetical protein
MDFESVIAPMDSEDVEDRVPLVRVEGDFPVDEATVLVAKPVEFFDEVFWGVSALIFFHLLCDLDDFSDVVQQRLLKASG